ncbi:reverse transcriptase domain-containing protein [Tanacetum coccineum]|uniref:Reverse transcriptase domain-containing protein n=1 Tax=Tanacetum coccineum TaxID=301880 RepID=A0ABQ5IJU2_9ASTR
MEPGRCKWITLASTKSMPRTCTLFPEEGKELASIMGYPYKCFLRLSKEYNQIKMTEDDEEKIGFHTEEGVYCFTHMLKELKNSAATLQRMMEEVLADQRGRNVEIYLEEIIDPVTSSFRVKEGRFLGFTVTKEGVRADPEKAAKIQIYDISYIPRRKAKGSVVKKFFGQGEQVEETPDANKGGTLNLSRKLQAKSTPTLRAWRLYLGRETIEEGSGIGIILVNPEEKMYSYVIRLKFNASNHTMDCKALLAGLATSISKGMKDLHVFMDSP